LPYSCCFFKCVFRQVKQTTVTKHSTLNVTLSTRRKSSTQKQSQPTNNAEQLRKRKPDVRYDHSQMQGRYDHFSRREHKADKATTRTENKLINDLGTTTHMISNVALHCSLRLRTRRINRAPRPPHSRRRWCVTDNKEHDLQELGFRRAAGIAPVSQAIWPLNRGSRRFQSAGITLFPPFFRSWKPFTILVCL
jgi:hypothetical protein